MEDVRTIAAAEVDDLCGRQESHIFDRKSRDIRVSKLMQTVSALANADGGELVVGIEDNGVWCGFTAIEDANAVLAEVAHAMRTDYYRFEFLQSKERPGCVLYLNIDRHPVVVATPAGDVYMRNSAQNRKVEGALLEALKRSKGDDGFERTLTDCTVGDIENSIAMLDLLLNGRAFSEPEEFLRKNGLAQDGRVSVAGVNLFADDPSDFLPNCAVKVYRYATVDDAHRDHLEGVPETLSGPVAELIGTMKERVVAIVNSIPRLDAGTGLTPVDYPIEALHEILTNSLLHRDYGMNDYVHVRIFDNRIEVDSPGRLHGHVTVENILDERSARNPLLQKVVNRFPDPPNMDIGEGLNTAFQAMEKLRLAYPVIEEMTDRVRVTIRHEPLASPEKAIMDYVELYGSVNNAQAREVTKIAQERTIRRLFGDLVAAGELVREGAGRGTRYLRVPGREGSEV